jgi:hypothetical protein
MKLIVLSALLCLSLCANAQIHWMLRAGPQISGAAYKRNGAKITTNAIAGFHAGVGAALYFDDRMSFVTGLQYSARGYKVKTLPGDTLKTYRLNYADIPVMLQFHFKKREEGLYAKLGPVVGIGIRGKEIYNGAGGRTIKNKAILSLTGNHFGMFDASLNAVLGYASSRKIFGEIGYAYGIGDINNDPAGPNIKSRVLSLSVGYFLR